MQYNDFVIAVKHEKHEVKNFKIVAKVVRDSIKKAAGEVVSITKSDKCGISVDSTWQYREHTFLRCC